MDSSAKACCLIFMFFLHHIIFAYGDCGTLRTPYFGKLHGQCEGNADDQCFLDCEGNFKVHGSPNKTCNSTSNKWEPIGPFSCQDRNFRCEGLRPPLNGNLRRPCSNFVGSSCYIGCDAGYVLEGSQRLICMPQTLKWTPEKPRCKPQSCPHISFLRNGFIKSGRCKQHVGAHCEFSCKIGYYLLGSRFRRCNPSGIWSGDETECVRTCSDVTPGANVRLLHHCSPGISGKSCNISCIDGHKLNGTRNYITCDSNGAWDGHLPQCIRTNCPPLEPPVRGSFHGDCRPGIYGVPCIFACEYGYQLIGHDSSYCQANGTWSQAPPVCQKITCKEISLTNVAELIGTCQPGLPDKWCNITCIPGYKIADGNNVTCLISGNWSSRMLECEKRIQCDPIEVPDNGFLDESCTFEIGSICKQLCNPEFVPVGTAYRTCLPSGHWDGIIRRCIPKSDFIDNNIHNIFK